MKKTPTNLSTNSRQAEQQHNVAHDGATSKPATDHSISAKTHDAPIDHLTSPSLKPLVEKPSLASQAFDHIKAAIIAGDVQPGILYSVNQFASLLGVSRTPVREALLTLSQQGFLRMDRNRGFQLTEITEKDINDVIEIRLMLEVPAMSRVAQLSSHIGTHLDEARSIYSELDAAAKSADVLRFLTVDRKFHLTLIDALDNHRLTKIVGDLRDHMQLRGLRRMASSGQLEDAHKDHYQLLLAVESGDSQLATNVMRMHLERTRNEWS